jgi:hypothetical protein
MCTGDDKLGDLISNQILYIAISTRKRILTIGSKKGSSSLLTQQKRNVFNTSGYVFLYFFLFEARNTQAVVRTTQFESEWLEQD